MNIDDKDLALQPVQLNTNPVDSYAASSRLFQGIPTIERTSEGNLWVAYYSGGKGEGPENYVVLISSTDNGKNWSNPRFVIDPPGKVRAFDPCLWMDPLGRLWLCWAQSFGLYDGRCSVWTVHCSDPASEHPQWSAPRRIGNGIMLNKPTVLSTGEWLFPTALWAYKTSYLNDLPEERYSNILVTGDQGESFVKRGFANVPNRHCDEHMVIERRDGKLWMLVRTTYGIGESFSGDQGRTWSPGRPTRLGGPNSRFFIRRLRSGWLLLVNHYGFKGRSHLTAQLSEDEGATWTDGLLIDERTNVAYPDGTEATDGTIYLVYDRERTKDQEILMAVFKEEDIFAGHPVSSDARMKVIVDRAASGDEADVASDWPWSIRQRELLADAGYRVTGSEEDKESKKVVNAAVNIIEQRLLEIRSLKEVSDSLGYSLSHLSRLFIKEIGTSLQLYYSKRKWQKAMDLLEEGNRSITEIAELMKYNSIHTFSRAFRQATGISPSQYVRKFKSTCETDTLTTILD
jgi:AraC-like DNA-binding protein